MSRPELTGHAALFYNEKEARKYHSSSRMVNVQREITLRAIELLLLPPDKTSYILDIGCGSGLSGNVLEEQGHVWVGCDVSRDMLQVAHERMEESMEQKNSTATHSHSKKNKQQDDDDQMMSDEEGNNDNDDDSDDSDEEEDMPSMGDLLHHVRVSDLECSISYLHAPSNPVIAHKSLDSALPHFFFFSLSLF